ncbi:MAG: creatininase family protein, partial [Halolamina sp.]
MVNLTPVSWAAKPYPEIHDIAQQDNSICIVPIGSLEQHGYHLPTGTDTLLVDAVATRGAERVADDLPVLLTPPLWVGYSPHHTPFGGTVTGAFDTLHDQIEQVADSVLANGFDTLLFLNGHGGNGPLVSAATATVGDAHPDAEILGLTYFELGVYFADDVRDSDLGGMAHGGELETSMLLHLHPELVDEDRIEATEWETAYEQAPSDLLGSGPLSVTLDVEEWSESGAMGDVSAVSAEKGERFLDGFVDELEALLR